MSLTLPTIKFLKQPTSEAWIEQAIAHLDTILLDHSHCERKAAGVALNLMFRYPAREKLVRMLTAIAREELEHFEQVNQRLEQRNIALGPLAAPPYGAGLSAQIRKQEPERLLDSLLVSALIEARSHERLGLLGDRCPDAELAKFYRSLMAKASPPLWGILDFSNNLFRSPFGDRTAGGIIIGRKSVAGNCLS